MSLAQLKFLYPSRDQKIRNYMEVQRSVNLFFDILEVYGRLEKNLSKIKKQMRETTIPDTSGLLMSTGRGTGLRIGCGK